MKPERCPTCGHRRMEGGRLTPREMDILTSWWLAGSVKEAARLALMTEQRAKTLLYRARIRNGVSTNDELLEMHFVAVRSRVAEQVSQNMSRGAVA